MTNRLFTVKEALERLVNASKDLGRLGRPRSQADWSRLHQAVGDADRALKAKVDRELVGHCNRLVALLRQWCDSVDDADCLPTVRQVELRKATEEVIGPLRCLHTHIPPFDAIAVPDTKNKRPDWARLICKQCGTFLGYQPPEEIAKAAGGPGIDLENSGKEKKSGA